MRERLVESWLTNASERSYQVPFSQVLIGRGHTILAAPAHHPFEHGKDLLSRDSEGALCAFQLKGGTGSFGLADFEAHQAQLHTLATTAIRHPSLRRPSLPDRVYLVTNQVLTPPARDRLTAMSEGLVILGFPAIEPLERDQLLTWFLSAHGSYFPQEPERVSTFLEIFLESGKGTFPKGKLAHFLADLLPWQSRTTRTECARAVTSAALMTSYMLEPWQRAQNHVGVAEGWIIFCSQVLRLADYHGLRDAHWEAAYLVAMEGAREALHRLLEEAAAAKDVLGDGSAETLVYGTRVLVVSGYLSAYALSSQFQQTSRQEDAAELRDLVAQVVLRERPYLKVVGEVSAPHYFMTAYLLNAAGKFRLARTLIMAWARLLASANAPHSDRALPDPYHSPDQILLSRVSQDAKEELAYEQWDGSSYTLHIAIAWLARRLWRQFLNSLWPQATEITQCDFNPSGAQGFLKPEDPDGQLRTWVYASPTSWRQLREESEALDTTGLSDLLLRRVDFLLLYPLVMPHRFSGLVDRIWDCHLGDRTAAQWG